MSLVDTSRLLLRPFREDDYEAVCAFRGDARVMRYITGAPEMPVEIAAFLKRAHAYTQRPRPSQYRLAIVSVRDKCVIGGCGLDITHEEWREGEIGYHLHVDYWGRGVGTAVAYALLKFGFEDLGLHRI